MNRILRAVALCAVAATAGAQSFSDITASTGLTMNPRPFVPLEQGWAVGDFDRDGDLDIIFPTAPGQPIKYFRNDGAMTFSDQTATAGLGIAPLCRQMTPADIDNDGDLDLFVTTNFVGNMLFINNGAGTFTEEGALRGVDLVSQSWAGTFGDFDRDGWVDLYVSVRTNLSNLYTPNRLYRNTGNGFFVDVTASSGTGEMGLTLASMWFDYNADGWPDIFCANDKGTSQPPNAVYRNDGNGSFTEVSSAINAMQGVCGMGLDFVDAFNDGGDDVFCTDSQPDHLFLVLDPTGPVYVPMQNQLGVGAVSSIGWGCQFLDYDNDAWQDLYVVHNDGGANYLWRNPAATVASVTPWINVTSGSGAGTTDRQYSGVAADFDGDGKVDILNAHQLGVGGATQGLTMLRNTTPGTAGWLRIRTEGVRGNRDGLGARVRVTTGSLTQEQQVRSAIGYITGSPMDLHFGLGAASQADRIQVTWPSGQVQTLDNVAGNQGIVIREPSLAVSGTPQVGTTVSLDLDVGGDPGLPYLMGLALSSSPGITLPSGRSVPLTMDAVFQLTTTAGNGVLLAPAGNVSALGVASSPMTIPNFPALVGWTIHSAAVTLDPLFSDGVRTIVDGTPFAIQ